MFVQDLFNNVRRMCSLRGDIKSRRWQVSRAMRLTDGNGYLVRNIDTNEFRAVLQRDLISLY
jgi:hypothetical protein